MAHGKNAAPDGPIIAGPGSAPIAAVGTSLVVHEWTGSGPSWLHVHRADDEAWHVLEGSLRFRFADREVDARAGTLLVPAGTPHTCRVAAQHARSGLAAPVRAIFVERPGDPHGSALHP
jgi:mannose-6-phosphate isomerase-like protein (cupin superfamily)